MIVLERIGENEEENSAGVGDVINGFDVAANDKC